jgi:hypothetical protein
MPSLSGRIRSQNGGQLTMRRVRGSLMNLDSKTKECRDANCRRAGKRLRRNEFHRNKRNKDRLHSYCRECTQRRSDEARLRSRPLREARKQTETQRKLMVIVTKVRQAVANGICTRERIAKETELSLDVACDTLAILAFEERSIRFQRVEGEARFYPSRAA